MATAPPLDLSTVQRRYPRLFRQFAYLSEREKESMEFMSDDMPPPTLDSATGLCTTMGMGIDFTEPLESTGEGCAMKTGSDAHKFCIFLWKCLNACESGSIGGDACRQFDMLHDALDDTLAMTTVSAKFEHLLGWTAAAYNHELHALLYRGDPDRNRSLFKAAGDAWKKVFEKTANGTVPAGIDEAYHNFAVMMCGYFHKLLLSAKKEYGEYAKYSFNFIKKTRAPKGESAAAIAKKTAAAAAPVSSSNVSSAPMTASTTKQVTASVSKPSKDAKIGLGLGQNDGTLQIQVTSIAPGSLFADTDLKVGMTLKTINGKGYASFQEGLALLRDAEGMLIIVAETVTSTNSSSPSLPAPVTSAPVSSTTAPKSVVSNQKENSIPDKNTMPESDDEMKPWEMDGWVPTTKSGKQKTPNVIRGELQRYIDQCKADGTMTQTRIIEKMGVNNNSFRRFMNPKTYKGQWSATQNGTYWAAARLLAEVKYEQDKAKKSGAKRKAGGAGSSVAKKAKGLSDAASATSSKMSKAEALAFIDRINAVEVPNDNLVFDSCPQLVTKIKTFLQRDGMTKAMLLQAFGNINSNSLGRFLSGKGQDQCGTVTYKAAYIFFERLRLLEGKPKSAARLKNESERPGGFSLHKSRGGTWKYLPGL